MAGGQLPLVDQPTLARLTSEVGEDSAKFLLNSLKQEIEMSLGALTEHLSDGDLTQLEIKAHALKSAARSFGAMQLGEVCMALEEAARAESEPSRLESLLGEFRQVSHRTLVAFNLH